MAQDIDRLIQELSDYRTRCKARLTLKQHAEEAAPKLLDLLQDEDATDNTRWAAMTVLASAKHEPAIPALLDVMRSNSNLRGEANRSLERITDKENNAQDVKTWKRIINGDEDLPDVSEESAEAGDEAESVTDTEALSLVKKALNDVASDIAWNEEGYAYLRLDLEGDRKQQMIINFDETDTSGRQLVCIYTECGPSSPDAEQMIYRRNVTLQYGKFTVETEEENGEAKIVMRHYLPVEMTNSALLRDIVLTMAREADNLEYELTNADHI